MHNYKVNVINISIRHAKQDSGSLLAWAKSDVFAFVIYYRQGTTEADKQRVGNWTRELIAAVIICPINCMQHKSNLIKRIRMPLTFLN